MQIHRIPDWFPGGIGAWAGLGYFGHLWVRAGSEGAIPHELVHVEQQKRDGYLRFVWRYITSPKWRVEYEAEAYALDVREGRHTLDEVAWSISGPLYFNPCTFDEARAAVLRFLSE